MPGTHRVCFEKSGSWRIFWYDRRGAGAVRLWKCEAATRSEAEALERAHAGEIAAAYGDVAHPRPAHGFMARLIADYKGSEDYKGIAESTKRTWRPHLDAILDTFGTTSLAGMQRKGVRKLIKAWHAGMSETPHKANTALTVLVRVLNYGVDMEDLQRNPALGLARIDEGEGRAGIVWSAEEFAKLLACSPPPMARALQLAWHTGLRREDLIRLRWNEVDFSEGLIRRQTLKSRKKKRQARIPLTPELRALLAHMPRTAAQVVTRGDGAAYTSPAGFHNAAAGPFTRADVRTAPSEEHPEGQRKHLHDMRGTRATHLFAAGASDADVEGFFGWAPGSGATMRGIYGDPESIALAVVKRQTGT